MFLLELYTERSLLKSKKAFQELSSMLSEEDLKTVAKSSEEFRKFFFHTNLFDTGIIIDMIRQKQYSPSAISPLTLIEVLRGINDKKGKKSNI